MKPRQKEFTWTSDVAYAIGLITTDGNLSKDGRHFDFISNDIDLIETLKKCLNLNNKICRKKSGYLNKFSSFHIQFGNVTLYRKLIDIGLMPNKSKILGSLDIPDEFFFDFLRGHLDGDGYIKKYFDPVYKNSLRLYINFISGSLKHLEWLQMEINRLIGIKGYMRQNTRAFNLTYSKAKSIQLLRHLYNKQNLPCLERKRNLIKEFI